MAVPSLSNPRLRLRAKQSPTLPSQILNFSSPFFPLFVQLDLPMIARSELFLGRMAALWKP
jgi:hypothetical protein